ncbi:hypothetical protein TNCV_4102771 [Trichonephila clavipes]|nr:hypothetical protein TNCV_4102771 [Trichonephila clavipes]
MKSLEQPDEIGYVTEEVVDLARKINLEVKSDDIQELLDSQNQEMTIDLLIEMMSKSKTSRDLNDGNVSRRYSTGRPRVITPNEDRYLVVTAEGNRRRTASDLSLQPQLVRCLRQIEFYLSVCFLPGIHMESPRGAEFVFMDDNARSQCRHRKRLTTMGGYHLYGLTIILIGHETSRSCVGHALPTSFSPSITSYMSTRTSECIA